MHDYARTMRTCGSGDGASMGVERPLDVPDDIMTDGDVSLRSGERRRPPNNNVTNVSFPRHTVHFRHSFAARNLPRHRSSPGNRRTGEAPNTGEDVGLTTNRTRSSVSSRVEGGFEYERRLQPREIRFRRSTPPGL